MEKELKLPELGEGIEKADVLKVLVSPELWSSYTVLPIFALALGARRCEWGR